MADGIQMIQVAGDHRAVRDRLDWCLQALEDAHERNETQVSTALYNLLQPHVPSIVRGMAITEAINLVFRGQERYLAGRSGGRASLVPAKADDRPDLAADHLDEAGARALTERIKRAAQEVSLLLLEAHERRAWIALGYRTWEQYVRSEFALSRPRSYELLDHGRLVLNIRRTTGLTEVANLTPHTARRLKPRLAEFVNLLRRRAATAETAQMAAVVKEVIDTCLSPTEPRAVPATDLSRETVAGNPLPSAGARGGIDVATIQTAIDYLAQLPPAPAVVDQIWDAGVRTGDVMCALEWLSEFAQELQARQAAPASGVIEVLSEGA